MEISEYKRLRELFDSIDHYGPLHILVADGNIADHHLLFCLLESLETHYPEILKHEEVELIQRLEKLSTIDRDHVYNERIDWLIPDKGE